jgi:glycosidase
VRVVTRNLDVVDMISPRQIFECFDKRWSIIQHYFKQSSPSAYHFLKQPISQSLPSLCTKHAEFHVVRQRTTTLNDVPEASRLRHVHGVDVHLAKQRRRGGDDAWYKDVMNLSKLAGATSPNKPMYISTHQGPPKP